MTAIALAAHALVHFRQKPPPPAAPMRFQIALPEKISFVPWLSLSPDGRHLAFTAVGQEAHGQLWVRDLDSLVSRPLAGTDGVGSYPFWSPDSRALGFQTGNKLERVDISEGAPQVICDAPRVLGGSWNQDGVIVFGSYTGVMKVSAAGGAPSLLIKARRSPGEHTLISPSFLPDGRHFLYAEVPEEDVYVGSLDAGSEPKPSKPLATGSMATDTPTSGSEPGLILVLKPDHTLMAQAFDTSRAELEGDSAVVAEGVQSFTISADGILAYTGGT